MSHIIRTSHGDLNPPLEPDLPYDIYLTQDPFDKHLKIEIAVKGEHNTLGMALNMCESRHQLQLQDMVPSTPGSRIPKWRSMHTSSHLTIKTSGPSKTWKMQYCKQNRHASSKQRALLPRTRVTVSTHITACHNYILTNLML